MPASMISEDTGSSWNVIGSSMAMVAVAPMPGSTPISVPSSTPIRQKARFSSEDATLKPRARFDSRSMGAPYSGSQGPKRRNGSPRP